MRITKKGYIRRFVKLFMAQTNMSYKYAKVNAEYFSQHTDKFYSEFVQNDVTECIEDHFR